MSNAAFGPLGRLPDKRGAYFAKYPEAPVNITKAEYIASLSGLQAQSNGVDCSDWALAHTTATAVFDRLVREPSPALRCRESQGRSRGDRNDPYVFAYAAPRFKPPGVPAVVMLFNASLNVPEIAHPFDSGGLGKHPRLRRSKSRLVAELTFQAPWRKDLALFVDALFAEPVDYLQGKPPARPDPLNIAADLLEHDPLFFTWEIKTDNRIEFAARLAAVLVTTDERGTPRVDEASERLLSGKARAREILLSVVRTGGSPMQDIALVKDSLVDLYGRTVEARRWR